MVINLLKLKITSDSKNKCTSISDDQCTDPVSGYMTTEDPESNSPLQAKENTELYHYSYNISNDIFNRCC